MALVELYMVRLTSRQPRLWLSRRQPIEELVHRALPIIRPLKKGRREKQFNLKRKHEYKTRNNESWLVYIKEKVCPNFSRFIELKQT